MHLIIIIIIIIIIFTKISHHRNISILCHPKLVWQKQVAYVRTISLNSHYLVLFENCRDAGQVAIFARQMYQTCWKFAVEGYEDATSVPYGCLLVDLTPDQDERCRLRTCFFFLESCSTCMFANKASDIRGEHWIIVYVNDYGHYEECLGCVPSRLFECYM